MISVREAQISDLSCIVDFQMAMAKETEDLDLDRKVVAKGVKAVLRDPGKGKYFIAVAQNNKVIASLLITFEWSDWRNGNVFWIHSVYVLKEYRKQGVYKKMYRKIQELVLNSQDLLGIRLYVDSKNLPAQRVYEKLDMDGQHYRLFEWIKPSSLSSLNK